MVGDEAYSLAAELLLMHRGDGARYLLRVMGQSLTSAWIGDGSVLVIEEDADPPDGEAVRLRAENGGPPDILAPVEDVLMQGCVVGGRDPPAQKVLIDRSIGE